MNIHVTCDVITTTEPPKCTRCGGHIKPPSWTGAPTVRAPDSGVTSPQGRHVATGMGMRRHLPGEGARKSYQPPRGDARGHVVGTQQSVANTMTAQRSCPQIRRPKTPPPNRPPRGRPPAPPVGRPPSHGGGANHTRGRSQAAGRPPSGGAAHTARRQEVGDRKRRSERVAQELETRLILSRRLSQSDTSLDRYDCELDASPAPAAASTATPSASASHGLEDQRGEPRVPDTRHTQDNPSGPKQGNPETTSPGPASCHLCRAAEIQMRMAKVKTDAECQTLGDDLEDLADRVQPPSPPSPPPPPSASSYANRSYGGVAVVQLPHSTVKSPKQIRCPQPVFTDCGPPSPTDRRNGPAPHPARRPLTPGLPATAAPVIDVKLVKDDDPVLSPCQPLRQSCRGGRGMGSATPYRGSLSRSAEDLDRLEILMQLSDVPYDYFLNKDLRSSFFEDGSLKRQTVYLNSDVQTLLKHPKQGGQEPIYSLPQPASYGEDTLKAVKAITDKYDTNQRMKLQALSFRGGDPPKLRGANPKATAASAAAPAPTISPPATLSPHVTAGTTIGTPPSGRVNAGPDSVDGDFIIRVSPPRLPEGTTDLGLDDAAGHPLGGEDAGEVPRDLVEVAADTLAARDVIRLEMFYKSRATEVTVCRCVADMYIGSYGGQGADTVTDWALHTTGVPVLVLNTGAGCRRRELYIVLAEPETGFPLWRDKVNYMTSYTALGDTDHVLQLSSSLRKVVKLSMFCADSARQFLASFRDITADPNDDLWKVSTKQDHRKSGKHSRRKKSFRKEDISQPCNFIHVTRIDPSGSSLRAAYPDILSGSNKP